MNPNLKCKVANYLRFLQNEKKDRNKEEEDAILEKLPNNLRDEITREINK